MGYNTLMQDLAYAITPSLPRINALEWERDGEEIKLSLLIGEEWQEETIKQEAFEKWLRDNDYLSGNEDSYGPENDYKGETYYWNYTYEEFITEHLTDEIVREYVGETNQYKFPE